MRTADKERKVGYIKAAHQNTFRQSLMLKNIQVTDNI